MTITLDWLGDDFPTFPQFQKMLRDYERELEPAKTLRKNESAIKIKLWVDPPVTPVFNAPVIPAFTPVWTEMQQLEVDGLVTRGPDGWEKTAAGVEAERLIEAEIARRTGS